MIRYRLPHEDLPEFYICKWCGASAEAIEDGRKPRYCAKNKRFKAPGAYVSYSSIEKKRIEIVENQGGIPLAFRAAPYLVVDDPGVGFKGWGFSKIMEAAFNRIFEATTRDGVALYSTSHPDAPPRLVDPDEWYIDASPEEIAKLKTRYVPPIEFTLLERCAMFCPWKGGGPCLADDCPRREKHENGDGV